MADTSRCFTWRSAQSNIFQSASARQWAAGLPEAEESVLDTADGERVIIWHVPPREGHPIFIYFHGNGGSLRWRAERFRSLTTDGSGLVALSYRGYRGSHLSVESRFFKASAQAGPQTVSSAITRAQLVPSRAAASTFILSLSCRWRISLISALWRTENSPFYANSCVRASRAV
jgi:hypothetical protein